ncbi:MAG: tRNA (N6-threonylcarbamoyladenosine(37)-N6)-methyltransferase TrmO, partial [Oscillospiraceae bacterium]|nr:tRNA (N6-threonylcarbamoyladenosine(37)-N6)-methyltransferase TrmO [Oscillospiraceae bacterium]
MSEHNMKVIARIRSPFSGKFGIPRQSGLVKELRSTIVFEPEFRNPDALRGMEGFSHLWLIWQFSEAVREEWSPTVRPPRLGGNVRMGVFATRSPFRPNPIGLSSVKLEAVETTESEGTVLIVSGADLLDGTPIYDIKPYLAYTDSHQNA